MSKKRKEHLMATEEYENRHKEIKDFHDNYKGWVGSSAGWPWFRGFIGKTRMEFQNGGCIKTILSILGWVVLASFIIWLLFGDLH